MKTLSFIVRLSATALMFTKFAHGFGKITLLQTSRSVSTSLLVTRMHQVPSPPVTQPISKHVAHISGPPEEAHLPSEDSYDGIVCDMDGVLWLGNEEISQSIDALKVLKFGGKSVVFVTNNSAKTKLDIQKKLASLGYDALLKDIVTSSSVTAEYLKSTLDSKRIPKTATKVYMIGNPALEEELTAVGFQVIKVTEEESPEIDEDEFSKISKIVTDEVEAVVVGIDYAFNYRKLAMGSLYLGRGALFVATNPDAANKVSSGALLPEPGALIAALESVSGKVATICGKPSDIIVKHVLDLLKCDPTRVMMVGDRLDTDIAFANKAGVASCLVLSGCTSAEEAEDQIRNPTDENKTPDFVANDLWDMVSPVASASLINLIEEIAPTDDPNETPPDRR